MKLMTHIVAGYPTPEIAEEVITTMDACGVSYIEVQIPFSDPIADGPTISTANFASLQNGMTPKKALNFITDIAPKVSAEIIIMTYFNIIFRYGIEDFCRDAKAAGCYGLIVPDMPIDAESQDHFYELCKKYNLHPICVVSPLTTDDRLKEIAEHASGLVYCMARTGITGTKTAIGDELRAYISRVKQHIKLPIAIGFGIQSKEDVQNVAEIADIAVIGTKILKLIEEEQGVQNMEKFLKSVLN